MRKIEVLLITQFVVISLAFAQDNRRESTSQVCSGNNLIVPTVPEFDGTANLLFTNQGIVVGSAFTRDDRQNPSLLHFQLFADGASPVTSMEMGSDGKIYVGYTPPRSPVWYDPTFANDLADEHQRDAINTALNGTHPFNEMTQANVDATNNWVPADRQQLFLRLGY